MLQRRRSACSFFQCRSRFVQFSLRLAQERLIIDLAFLTGHNLSFEFRDILLPAVCASNAECIVVYPSERDTLTAC